MADPVLTFTEKGIYCPAGDFFIDPHRAVARALITHGHSDHARTGMGSYLATDASLPVLRHRLGRINAEGIGWGARRQIGGATVSFHPAGHVPGSAQIRVEVGGEVWVVSGDYKTESDGFSEPFEPVRCHAFISECTFGLPVYHWRPQDEVLAEIAGWWQANAALGVTSVMGAYSFGKAQRLIAGLVRLGALPGPILTHATVEATNRILAAQGYALPETTPVTGAPAEALPGALVIAPPAAMGGAWVSRLKNAESAFAAGWMAVRGIRRRRGAQRGFAISDHADWPGLNAAIRETGADRVFVTHGFTQPFRRWLAEQGHDARIVETGFGGEEPEEALE